MISCRRHTDEPEYRLENETDGTEDITDIPSESIPDYDE